MLQKCFWIYQEKHTRGFVLVILVLFFSCFSVALKKFAPLHFPASAVLHVSCRRARRVTAAALVFTPPPILTN